MHGLGTPETPHTEDPTSMMDNRWITVGSENLNLIFVPSANDTSRFSSEQRLFAFFYFLKELIVLGDQLDVPRDPGE